MTHQTTSYTVYVHAHDGPFRLDDQTTGGYPKTKVLGVGDQRDFALFTTEAGLRQLRQEISRYLGDEVDPFVPEPVDLASQADAQAIADEAGREVAG